MTGAAAAARVVRGEAMAARCRDLARNRGCDPGVAAARFLAERFLARLAASAERDRFVLRGGHLLAVWEGDLLRATGDVDLLDLGDGSAADRIAAALGEVPADEDGVAFDPSGVRSRRVAGGERLLLPLRLGRSGGLLVGVQVRRPPSPPSLPELLCWPSVLPGLPPLRMWCARREAVLAEKLVALAAFGAGGTRLADVHDAWWLLRRHSFARHALVDAARAALAGREELARAIRAGGDGPWRAAFEAATAERRAAWAALPMAYPGDGRPAPEEALASLAEVAVPVLRAAASRGGDAPGALACWRSGRGWTRPPPAGPRRAPILRPATRAQGSDGHGRPPCPPPAVARPQPGGRIPPLG